MTTAPAPDPARCPLCGLSNRCAMELERTSGQSQPPCWCTATTIPRETLARIPAEARNQACICPACAALAPPPPEAAQRTN
jgi:hypothetical protein